MKVFVGGLVAAFLGLIGILPIPGASMTNVGTASPEVNPWRASIISTPFSTVVLK